MMKNLHLEMVTGNSKSVFTRRRKRGMEEEDSISLKS